MHSCLSRITVNALNHRLPARFVAVFVTDVTSSGWFSAGNHNHAPDTAPVPASCKVQDVIAWAHDVLGATEAAVAIDVLLLPLLPPQEAACIAL